MPPTQYFALLHEEIRQKSLAYPQGPLSTVYFGGGTPSLVPAHHIVSVLEQLTRYGFTQDTQTEITLEINPATIDEKKMEIYLNAGVYRFSVGAQTFNDALLKSVNREHDSQQTRDTLSLLKSLQVNFSLDLLFALPGYSLDLLKTDLTEILSIRPNHVSPYCLTVPEGHVLSAGRPEENDQIQMFEVIDALLSKNSYERYEISNYCLPGFESRHNMLYWDDENYAGLGLSAHSYDRRQNWGTRFWNAKAIGAYEKQILANKESSFLHPYQGLPETQLEHLHKHQSLTDFCHTSLRRGKGLSALALQNKFGEQTLKTLKGPLAHLVEQGLLEASISDHTWTLSKKGVLLSNQVFGTLTFLDGEVP